MKIQVSVEADQKLINHYEGTNENDANALLSLTIEAKKVLNMIFGVKGLLKRLKRAF